MLKISKTLSVMRQFAYLHGSCVGLRVTMLFFLNDQLLTHLHSLRMYDPSAIGDTDSRCL